MSSFLSSTAIYILYAQLSYMRNLLYKEVRMKIIDFYKSV